MGECYFEEEVADLADTMRGEAHVVGEGAIGAAAVSGKHHWICSDTCSIDSSPTSADDKLDMFRGTADCKNQLNARIKTIAHIPLPSCSVVQFGSSQKILESSEFVDEVQNLFRRLGSFKNNFLDVQSQNANDNPDPHASIVSETSFGDAYSSKNISFLNDRLGNEHSTVHIQPSSFFSMESEHDIDTQGSRKNPHVLVMPIVSSSIIASKGSCNSLNKQSLFQLTGKYQAVGTGAQSSTMPNIDVHCSYNFPENPVANYSHVNTWAKDIFSLPMLEQRPLSDKAMQGLYSSFTRESSSFSHANKFHLFGGGSSGSCKAQGSQSMTSNSCLNVTSSQHSTSSLSFPVVGLPTEKSFTRAPSFDSELPDSFFNSLQDLTPDNIALAHCRDDSINELVNSSNELIEKLSDVRTEPTKDDLFTTCCVSSALAGSCVGCSQSMELPTRPIENPTTAAANSLDTCFEWKANSSYPLTELVSNDVLFDGMVLDLGPEMLEPNHWDDIMFPVGSGSSSNLSAGASDCIDKGSTEGGDKGLFSESTLEQLLGAVVAGSSNSSSSNCSIARNANSLACNNLEHQGPDITKSGGSLAHMINSVPLVGQTTSTRASDMSSHEYNMEKILQSFQKDALMKTCVSSWIDDSCSINAESVATNQPKKSDDAGKAVRKRARPGESTRPRPKDRQQIQDRVKELREMVPNGAKCSIDSLLDRTIRHMLFLQSVTKYADKLKQADEPKIIGDESGVVLKDNLSVGGGGGATWAYEVAGQTMVCPILVEDVNPPGQMIVEMLCEERGFFLEIADIIRGFGLTILKGVMEARDSKIWARFLVEANRDVTRMDIFLSLVQLLQQTSCIRSSGQPKKGAHTFSNHQHSAVPVPFGLADSVQ